MPLAISTLSGPPLHIPCIKNWVSKLDLPLGCYSHVGPLNGYNQIHPYWPLLAPYCSYHPPNLKIGIICTLVHRAELIATCPLDLQYVWDWKWIDTCPIDLCVRPEIIRDAAETGNPKDLLWHNTHTVRRMEWGGSTVIDVECHWHKRRVKEVMEIQQLKKTIQQCRDI